MCKLSSNRVSTWLILFSQLLPAHSVAQTVTGDSDATAYTALQSTLDGTSLDINVASRNVLASFPMIGPTGAQRVIANRSAGRSISDVGMLADILGWSTEDADFLRPYLRFSTRRQPSAFRSSLQTRVTANGGSSKDIRVLSRTRIRSGTFDAAFVTERDPGETSLVDHWAGYVEYRPGPGIEVFAGDLRPGFGLGVLYSRQSRSSVASAPSNLSRSSRSGRSRRRRMELSGGWLFESAWDGVRSLHSMRDRGGTQTWSMASPNCV